tara:strand:- start:4412 stop:5536 length:1125 start_codon:yes stop_codon:yes gene_type:complete
MPHVIIVDDAIDNRLVLSTLLEADYQTSEAESGDQCLELLQTDQPDLILLDISMPGISGYDTCVAIRKNPATSGIPVIFVSAKDSPEERLEGFEAGADDFLTKPIDGTVLQEKVKFHIQRSIDKKEALKQSREAMNVAMEAMTSSSELGQLIQLLRAVHQIEQQQPLADTIRNSIGSFNLSCCVMIRAGGDIYSGCERGSLEASLMEKFHASGQRMTHLGNRTLIDSASVVTLIKNMPVDEETRYGRFKDLLVMITDVASDRAVAIEAGHTLEMKQQRIVMLKKIISLAEDCVTRSGRDIDEFSSSLMNAIRDMINAQDDLLHKLGLDDDQEDKLRRLANITTDRIEQASGRSEELGASLQHLVDVLKELLKRQ